MATPLARLAPLSFLLLALGFPCSAQTQGPAPVSSLSDNETLVSNEARQPTLSYSERAPEEDNPNLLYVSPPITISSPRPQQPAQARAEPAAQAAQPLSTPFVSPILEPQPLPPLVSSFFDGAWNGFAFSPNAIGPLFACESQIIAGEGLARARAGQQRVQYEVSDQGWRLTSEDASGAWAWSKASAGSPDRLSLSAPGFSCALSRPAHFRAALLEARRLGDFSQAGQTEPSDGLALIGFEISAGALGRPCAVLASPSGLRLRLLGSTERFLPSERLSFERPEPVSQADSLFFSGASLKLARSETSRLGSLHAAPQSGAPSVQCQLASPSWWTGMAPAAEPSSL